jgi:AbrB family looped-hinge helix DNA binding protein
MPATATVSEKGQVTVPKHLRDRLGIRAGSQLEFRLAADGTVQVHVMATGSSALSGLLAKPGEKARALAEMDAGVTAVVRARARRKP